MKSNPVYQKFWVGVAPVTQCWGWKRKIKLCFPKKNKSISDHILKLNKSFYSSTCLPAFCKSYIMALKFSNNLVFFQSNFTDKRQEWYKSMSKNIKMIYFQMFFKNYIFQWVKNKNILIIFETLFFPQKGFIVNENSL